MKNIVNRTLAVKKNIKKSIFIVMVCFMASMVYGQTYNHVGVAAGTINVYSASNPGASSKFYKYTDGVYLWRASSNHSFSTSNGIKTQNSQSGLVFYLAESFDVTPTVLYNASKNFANVNAILYTISAADYDKFFTGTNNNTVVTFAKTEYETKTIVINAKGEFQETFSALPVGYYFLVCTGTASDTYFKSLTFTAAGPVAVTGVTLNKSTTSIEAGQSEQLTATVLPSNAGNKAVTWSTSNPDVAQVDQQGNVSAIAPGNAIITVTTADGGKEATCQVTVTAPPTPVEVTGISIKQTTTIAIGESETLSITYSPADANTGKGVTWSSGNESVATVNANGNVTGIAAGTAIITVTSTTNPAITASCTVTVQAVAVTGISLNKSSLNIQISGTETLIATITPSNATNKSITWSSDKTNIATVNNGVVTGIGEGTAVITVKTADGGKEATCNVTVTAGPPVPSTDLTIHVPEIYEATTLSGGYGGKLRVFGGREYEVYYPGKLESNSALTVDIEPVQKRQGIAINNTSTSCQAQDGWFKVTANSVSNFTFTEKDEFAAGEGCMHKIYDNKSYLLHIQGFDQFSFYGKDNSTTIEAEGSSKNKRFRVYIDGILQPENKVSAEGTIRRYDISTGEHLIEVKGIGGSNNEFYGFSLRVAQEPRTKWLKGNDSTQTVLATTAPRPIYYFTKYGNISGAETRLEWVGNEATGLSLSKQISGDLGDTLMLGGIANCPAGVYNYKVASYFNGTKTTEVAGKIEVINSIKAITDTVVDAYIGEEMDEIKFRFYNVNPDGWQVTSDTWPNGITRNAANNIITISGTPTAEGEYTASVCVEDGNCVNCTIRVSTIDYGANPVLYLYKNNLAYEHDGVYDYLKNSDSRNLIARKAKDALRSADQYAKYKWILISEDVDADNPEVLAAARGETGLPVLNMKSFSYSPNRLDWGEPDNGSLTKDNGRFITVLRGDHPIFQGLNKKQGDRIQILDTIILRGLMPAAVDYEGTLCLATAWTRDIEDYHGDGVRETFLHEVPASMHNGKKYICMPIGKASSQHLTADGKRFVKAVVNYLLSDQATVAIPELKITSFKVNGIAGAIDQDLNTIDISIDITKYPSLDLTAVVPEVTVASPLTHVTPLQGEAVDLSKSSFSPVVFEVSDYINRRTYDVTVHTFNPQSIDEVYTVGEWVNIYDIYGRKLTTTNENIYTMSLPRGVYMVVTANGQTIKILR